MYKHNDLLGSVFGRLTVIAEAGRTKDRCTADEPQTNYVLSKDSDAYKFNKRMEVEEGWLKEQSGKE